MSKPRYCVSPLLSLASKSSGARRTPNRASIGKARSGLPAFRHERNLQAYKQEAMWIDCLRPLGLAGPRACWAPPSNLRDDGPHLLREVRDYSLVLRAVQGVYQRRAVMRLDHVRDPSVTRSMNSEQSQWRVSSLSRTPAVRVCAAKRVIISRPDSRMTGPWRASSLEPYENWT